MAVRIAFDLLGDEEFIHKLEKLRTTDIDKAIRAGVKYAARGGRAVIGKSISARYSVGSGRVKQDVSQPTYQDGGKTAIIRTSRKPITFASYKARDIKPKGVSVAIYKGQRSVHPKAFGAKGLFFVRKGAARYPLNVLKGPSVHAIYTGGKHSGDIKQQTEDRIEQQLVTGIKRSVGSALAGF